MYKTTRKNNISRLPQMKHRSLVVQMYLKHLKNRNVFFVCTVCTEKVLLGLSKKSADSSSVHLHSLQNSGATALSNYPHMTDHRAD